MVEAELRKKKGGKGLSVLSGRDLYEYKKELFVDDEDAADDIVLSDRLGANEELDEEAEKRGELDEVLDKVDQSLFLDEGADANVVEIEEPIS